MMTLEQIKDVVSDLPKQEYRRFRRWFLERDWRQWDKQIAADAAAGKLDFLVEEAREAKRRGKLKDL